MMNVGWWHERRELIGWWEARVRTSGSGQVGLLGGLMACTILFVAVFSGASTQAQELPESAEQSDDGASTIDPAPEPEQTETPAVTAGWDDGFVLQSADGRFRLSIGGWIQPRYEFIRRSGAEDTSSIWLRRTRVDITGHTFLEELTFRLMPEFAGEAVTLRDAWLDYAFSSLLRVRAGQFTVPFQWHRAVSARRQHFAGRGVSGEELGFADGRDHGLMVHGENDTVTVAYGVGVFDGAGRNISVSDSVGNMVSGRVGWAMLGTIPDEESDLEHTETPNVALGAGVQGAHRNEVRNWELDRSTGENPRADWVTTTADVALQWRGLSVVVDGQIRRVDPYDDAVDAYMSWGAMVTGGIFVVPQRYEVVGRVSRHRIDSGDSETEETEWGAGLNLYHWAHDWKTRLNFMCFRRVQQTDWTVLLEHHLQF